MNAELSATASPRGLPSLLHLSIADISEALQSKQISSYDLVNAYIQRIEETKEFRAVLEINSDALHVARDLDDERVQSGPRK